MKKQATFTIEPELLEMLRELAYKLRKSKAQLIEEAIKLLIEEHEDGDRLQGVGGR
jgi:predicted DNA-binding protein